MADYFIIWMEASVIAFLLPTLFDFPYMEKAFSMVGEGGKSEPTNLK